MGDKPAIHTECERTPWGIEWIAFREGYDGGSYYDKNAMLDGDPIGWGKTAQEAIDDLIDQEQN